MTWQVLRAGWPARDVSNLVLRHRHPRTRSPSSQSACFGEQTTIGSGRSAYTSRTALLTKRNAVRSTNHLVTKLHDGAVNVASASEDISLPDASPPRCAQLVGLALRGCRGAHAERHSREEESFLPVRPWSAVDPYPRSTPFIQVKQQNEVGRGVRGHSRSPSP